MFPKKMLRFLDWLYVIFVCIPILFGMWVLSKFGFFKDDELY